MLLKPLRLILVVFALLAAATLYGTASQVSAAVTVDQARKFFKEFDEHTLSGRGKQIDRIYGRGNIRGYLDDLNPVLALLGTCRDQETLEAHGKKPDPAEQAKYNAEVARLKAKGSLG